VTSVGIFLGLNHWAFANSRAFHFLDGQAMPWLQDVLGRTFLGAWKDGKLINALGTRSPQIAEIILKGVLAAGFLVVLPIIHPTTRRRWWDYLRGRFPDLAPRSAGRGK